MNEKKKVNASVVENACLAEGIYSITLKTELAKTVLPGQFIGVYPKDQSTLLMRPISVCEADSDKETLRIVFRVVGKGTDYFATLQAGDTVDILGNIGNGFPVEEYKNKNVCLMGGGIGIPPMLGCAKNLSGKVYSFLGYRNADTFLCEDFEKYSNLYIASEDGSVGTKGNVLDALAASGIDDIDAIFACGPMPMLRAIKKYAEENNITAYISLEERMACGVGACLGCVCKTTQKDEHLHVFNTRICTEGPVFEAGEVDI